MEVFGRLAPASPLERRSFPMASSELAEPPQSPQQPGPARLRQKRNFDILAQTPGVVCRFGPHNVATLRPQGQARQPEVFVTLPHTLLTGLSSLGCGAGVTGGGLAVRRGLGCLTRIQATAGMRALASSAGAAGAATICGGLVLMLGSLWGAHLALRWVQASGRLALRENGQQIPLSLVTHNDSRLALNYLRVEDVAMAGVIAPALAFGALAGSTGMAVLFGALGCIDAAHACWALSAARGVRLEPDAPAHAPLMARAPALG